MQMRHPEIEEKISDEFYKLMNIWNPQNYDYEDTINSFKDVIERYNEKHRFYHDLAHIDMSLNELRKKHLWQFGESYKLEEGQDHILYVAILLHDVIYNPMQNDKENVLQSIEYARHPTCPRFGLFRYYDAEKVCELIKVTDHSRHYSKQLTSEQQLMQDLDLVIFGQTEPIFNQYDENIRKEYWWVPPLIYADERKKILKKFLSRKFIYQTSRMREKYEEKARENLERAIKRLEIKTS
jgi:predicted metal-dependent HD superfamily phosphohydrolase